MKYMYIFMKITFLSSIIISTTKCTKMDVSSRKAGIHLESSQLVGGDTCENINDCRLFDFYKGGGLNSLLQCSFFRPPTIFNGILTFGNRSQLSGYLVGLDSLQAKWKYSIGDEDQANIGDEAIRSVDMHYGIQSLLSKNDNAEFNGAATSILDSSIIDPDIKKILNSKLEIIIGDTIFKYIDIDLVAIIPNKNLTVLEDVSKYGYRSIISGVVFYDEQQNTYTSNESNSLYVISQSTSGCREPYLKARASKGLNGNWNDCNLQMHLWAPLTDISDCSLRKEYFINWGDGTPIQATGECGGSQLGDKCNIIIDECPRTHTYDQSLITGASKEFIITITARTLNHCNPSINNKVYSYSVKYTVFKELDCKQGQFEKSFSTPNTQIPYAQILNSFSVNGVNYRVRGKMGQNLGRWRNGWFFNPKVWAEVIFEKYKNSKWVKTTPLYDNYVSIYGYINKNCNMVQFMPIETKRRRAKSFVFKRKFTSTDIVGNAINYGTTKLFDYQFQCDVLTSYPAGTYFGITGTKLWY